MPAPCCCSFSSKKSVASKLQSCTEASHPLLPDPPLQEYSISEHVEEWQDLLDGDYDCDYLLHSVAHSFVLHDVDAPAGLSPSECPRNYHSTHQHRAQVEAQLLAGLEEGYFRVLASDIY